MTAERLTREFYTADALTVAPALLGKTIVCCAGDTLRRFRITETEAYCGVEDLACHASRGRTPRTEAMYCIGGTVYVYLIYGMYWMLNVVTGGENCPQAVLLRGIEGINGPGRLARLLCIDRSFYGEDLTHSSRIWIENDGYMPPYSTGTRIGINYAGEWKEKEWRYWIDNKAERN